MSTLILVNIPNSQLVPFTATAPKKNSQGFPFDPKTYEEESAFGRFIKRHREFALAQPPDPTLLPQHQHPRETIDFLFIGNAHLRGFYFNGRAVDYTYVLPDTGFRDIEYRCLIDVDNPFLGPPVVSGQCSAAGYDEVVISLTGAGGRHGYFLIRTFQLMTSFCRLIDLDELVPVIDFRHLT
ncbi:MAG: hypothetical protein A3F54_01805 [Candidatus Kerfeldbacteria bacterium RIFCSPHIGHO2_12_FULL_48_17]|uniref:Uncharacterized protein n=1 Tax=Candidatus Kerfeldbacteria bacterium RIFCSPHIGHO2_12_FULL_48_17 TaxID=1798542 RepID=A0A1G2AYN7_9BACT|nr:MAG: hypothetical protein A3F54_01805 [Candidatus Kerfeldbacteria bacterium RIFCSPHIGHO2_12_FULL_48_17]